MTTLSPLAESLLNGDSQQIQITIPQGDEQFASFLTALDVALDKEGGFKRLSELLGHDPEDEENDYLSPEELSHDPGWTYDVIKSTFREEAEDGSYPVMTELVKLAQWKP